MIKAIGRLVATLLVAVIAFGVAGVMMMAIPNTPAWRGLQQAQLIVSYRPEQFGGSILDWSTICSAPCEVRGELLLLFYNCDSKLAAVMVTRADTHQGCVLDAPWPSEGQR